MGDETSQTPGNSGREFVAGEARIELDGQHFTISCTEPATNAARGLGSNFRDFYSGRRRLTAGCSLLRIRSISSFVGNGEFV
jgi:hypothetical protein